MEPSYIYDIDDRPPLRNGILYALQWSVIMFPIFITSAALVSKVLRLEPALELRFFQLTLLTSGFFTVVQCLWGHRYPVIDGPSTALLLTFLILAPYGIPAIQGGAVLGSLLLILAVLVVKPRRIIPIMTPNVVGVILMLIALTILPYLSRLMSGATGSAGASAVKFLVSIVLVLLIATLGYRLRGFLKTISLLIGILIGTGVFYALELPEMKTLHETSWLSVPSDFIPYRPILSLPAIIAFAVSYVAVVVNSVGSIQAIANVTSRDRLERSIPMGLLINGVGGLVCAIMGIIGTVSFSLSPGVVLTNRVASRFAVAYSGILMMIAAFIPPFAALLAMVPPPVVGAALCAAMGVQIGAALSIISKGGMEQRDYYVVGLPVLLGTLIGFVPQGLLGNLPQVLQVFAGNGLTFGIISVLLLEHVLMRK